MVAACLAGSTDLKRTWEMQPVTLGLSMYCGGEPCEQCDAAEDMTCELHDEVAAGSQFVTHFTGRVLERLALTNTPINTKA